MSIFREFNISMIPGKPPLIIHVSQYESDFVYTFNLVSGRSALAIPDTSIAVIRGTKRDGNGYSAEVALDAEKHKVVVMGDPQLTACAGRNVFELAIINNGKTICTSNFFLEVERAPLDSDTITSETVLHDLQAIINSAATATQAAEEASASAESAASAAEQAVEEKFEDGVAETIDEWLTNHPEATTTVQDGSITEPKLADALKLKTIKDFVTPEMFGAVGDGVADDSDAIQNALDSGNPVKFVGKYLISKTIEITTDAFVDGNNAIIKVSNDFADDYAIHIYGTTTTRYTFICGLYIDCNALNIVGIYVQNKRINLYDCIVQYCGGTAYYLKEAGGTHVVNCSATNVGSRSYTGSEFADSIALKNDSADTYIDTFDFIDFHIGVQHLKPFGFYNNIHGFVLRYLAYFWDGSCFFKTVDNYFYALTLLNCYPDTQQYSYMFVGHGEVNIIGGATYFNSSVWNEDTRTKDNTFILSKTGDVLINFVGVTIRGGNPGSSDTDYLRFTDKTSNVDMQYVTITNCLFHHVVDNIRRRALNLPSFSGRSYNTNEIIKINERTFNIAVEFTITPSVHGAIVNDGNIATFSSPTFVGSIPDVVSLFKDKANYVKKTVLNAMYYEIPSSAHAKVYPLNAYTWDGGIYIRPLDGDTLLTDATNTTTYTIVVTGTISFGVVI